MLSSKGLGLPTCFHTSIEKGVCLNRVMPLRSHCHKRDLQAEKKASKFTQSYSMQSTRLTWKKARNQWPKSRQSPSCRIEYVCRLGDPASAATVPAHSTYSDGRGALRYIPRRCVYGQRGGRRSPTCHPPSRITCPRGKPRMPS